jgi:MarR family 2-MHQ and catechol resistance regulon transcriptional repressor
MSLDIALKTLSNLVSIGYWVGKKNDVFFKQYDLSTQQYHVLRVLRNQNGDAISLSELHNRMLHKMSNTSRLVDKLIDKDYVDRKKSTTNKRKVEISISKNGAQLLAKIDLNIQEHTLSINKNLDRKEALILNELLNKIQKS